MLKDTPLRIGIDGFNLGLEKGTGVATYARMLSRALTGIGHPVDVLYGLDVPKSSDPALREVSFFDTLNAAPQHVENRYSQKMVARPKVYSCTPSGRKYSN